jgi:hypothetical protein
VAVARQAPALSIAVFWCSAIGRSHMKPSLAGPRPFQLLEAQPLRVTAIGARHEEAPLVGGLVLPFDVREAADRRRRDQEDLALPEFFHLPAALIVGSL